MKTALDRAIDIAGSVGKLADSIGLRQNVVSNWRLRGQVPAERCLAIEDATGGQVTRHDLRPDVFGDAPADVGEAA
jgi:DNA-binding transcriptional regulator YdaS (Cro superfamily)